MTRKATRRGQVGSVLFAHGQIARLSAVAARLGMGERSRSRLVRQAIEELLVRFEVAPNEATKAIEEAAG